MPRYNHMFDIAFEVISDHPEGEDVTPEMLKAGLLRRIEQLGDGPGQDSWAEATGLCDSYQVDDPSELVLGDGGIFTKEELEDEAFMEAHEAEMEAEAEEEERNG